MSAPAQLPNWNTGGANRVDPSGAKKILGWVVAEPVDSSFFNWWMYTVYLWCVYLQGLPAEAITWTNTHVFQKGITVTHSVLNGTGATVTGNGTGHGVKGTAGGSASYGLFGQGVGGGNGVYGEGSGAAGSGGVFVGIGAGSGCYGSAAGSGAGVEGAGGFTFSGPGVKGTGGSAGGTGVKGVGGTSGKGVEGTGDGSATGGYFTGGSNGTGVEAYGNGAGYGLYAYALGSASGIKGSSTSGTAGVEGVGVGAGVTGVKGTGGASGIGVWGVGGGGNYGVDAYGGAGAPGFRANRTDGLTASPAIVSNGTIDLDGSATPTSTAALKNKLTRMNVAKAQGHVIMNNSTSPTINSVQNATVTGTASTVTVVFAQAMLSDYEIVHTIENLSTYAYYASVTSKSTTGFTVTFYKWTVSGANLVNTAPTGSEVSGLHLAFAVFGDQ